MQDGYEFVVAGYEDIPAVLDIYKSLIGTSGCAWNEEYPDKTTAESDIGDGALYLLKHNDEIIAVASIESADELKHLTWTPNDPCQLSRIGVVAPFQGQGIGTVILQKTIEAAREKGFDGIAMLVSKTNPSALALYDKNGFERCGETSMYGMDFYCYEMTFAPAK